MTTLPRVLSIQSHVVSGYVGLKSSTFPLQLLGFDVDPLPTVCFSNHTGYKGGFKGTRGNVNEMMEIFEGLEANGLLKDVGIVVTGYIGGGDYLRGILEILKKTPPSTRYVCDPVMGDNGKLYVSPELVDIFRDDIIPRAWLIAPNAFEASILTGLDISGPEDCKKAIRLLHDKGPEYVVVTSVSFDGRMLVMMSSKTSGEVWQIETPIVPGKYTGTGDLFTSLIVAHMVKSSNVIPETLKKTVKTLYYVIKRTNEYYGGEQGELRIVQGKDIIEMGGECEEGDGDIEVNRGNFFTPSKI